MHATAEALDRHFGTEFGDMGLFDLAVIPWPDWKSGLLWGVGEAYYRIRGIEGMGFGDVKMMAMVGAFLGAPLALLTIMMGSVLGAIIGGGLIQFGGKHRHYELPFGTFLGLAGIVSVLYGEPLIQWYFVHMIRPAL
jgi:prepilin signal peptidase PulO-like enzyme (type II secretory pathway)